MKESSTWPWTAAAVIGAALAHAPALANGLVDADRLLLVRNTDLHSFVGLGALFAKGEPIERASALIFYNHGPLAVLSSWLGWQWFRANGLLQHAAGLAIACAVAGAVVSLLAPRARLGMSAALALMLYPCAADLTGPLLGRETLIAVVLVLLAARRARDAKVPAGAVAWSTLAGVSASACSVGWGLLGLVAAGLIEQPRTRRIAAGAVLGVAAIGAALMRSDLAGLSLIDAIGPGAGGAFFAWLPSHRPFVLGSIADWHIAGLVPSFLLIAGAWLGAARTANAPDAALLRAGAASVIASVAASALACRQGTVTGAGSFFFQLGVVLTLCGVAGAARPWAAERWRRWMTGAVAALALAAACVTAARVRGWAGEDQILRAIAARSPDDPEAWIASARLALRRGSLDEAMPYCVRHAEAAPESFRTAGCLAAGQLALGHEQEAIALMRSWASRFPEQRALRTSVLELAEAQSDPRFGELFRRATGFNMPTRRPGESR